VFLEVEMLPNLCVRLDIASDSFLSTTSRPLQVNEIRLKSERVDRLKIDGYSSEPEKRVKVLCPTLRRGMIPLKLFY
jgi:hypothetical protein